MKRMGDPDWFRDDEELFEPLTSGRTSSAAPNHHGRVQRFEVSVIPANRDATPPPPPTPARETSPGIGSDDPPETTRILCRCPVPKPRPGQLGKEVCRSCGRLIQ